MSLDVYLSEKRYVDVFGLNITHNLNKMADAAGIYKHIWRTEDLGITKAGQLIEPLRKGLSQLQENPEKYKKYNPENGWGDYYGLVEFVRLYLEACEASPDADVRVSA